MIQDIAPHRYDNSFRTKKPSEADFVLYIKNNQTLLFASGEEPEAGDGTGASDFEIPTFKRIRDLIKAPEERAVYLFAIDNRAYFLLEDELGESEIFLDPEKLAALAAWKDTQYFRRMVPAHQSFAAITATQLWRWRQSRKFCGRCGARTRDSLTERALVCPECGQIEYPKISPAVIVAITNGDKLLMSRYRDRPYRGYALIAGFVEIGETFEETVRREVMEEVGLKVKNIRYFKSQPWAFTDTEMIGFFADLDGSDEIRLQEDELSEAAWYRKEEIPDDDVLISVGSEMKMAFKYGRVE